MKLLTTILFILFTTLAFTVSAKDNKELIKANYYYNNYAYAKAIPSYEKVAADLKDPVIYARLGDCYNITGNFAKAMEAYASAVQLEGCSNDVKLRYAQLLMQLTHYTEAEEWLTKYKEGVKTDRRADNLIAGCKMARTKSHGSVEGFVTFLPFNTDGSEFAPAKWNGQLVFTSDTVIDLKKKKDKSTGHAYYNIYSVACDNNGNCATEVNSLTTSKSVNIKYHNGPATFSADGKQMFYTRSAFKNKIIGNDAIVNKDSVVALEIMIASDFDSSEKSFKTIVPFRYNSKEYAVAHPTLSPDGKLLAFSSNMPRGQGKSDIYFCKKINGNQWSRPQTAGISVNTEGDEVFPYWADNETLYFSSDGQVGIGGLDIYKCKWDEASSTFSMPENIGAPYNSSYDDISLAINTDSAGAWFSSNRPAERGGDNIYYYAKRKVYVQLHILDSLTRQPINNAHITITSAKDRIDTIANNSSYFRQMSPGQTYNFEIEKEDYFASRFSAPMINSKPIDTVSITALLVKQRKMQRDTLANLVPQQLIVRNTNVMDSPGVKGFTVDKTYEVGDFHFDYNKYDLKPSHKPFLDTLMAQLNRNPNMRIEIQAHTDCRGSVTFNKTLSEKRALSVVNYLIQHGIAASRLAYVGLGNSQPKVKCPDCNSCTEEQHSLNRIMELKVLEL